MYITPYVLRFQLICLTLCTITHGAYYRRMAPLNRMRSPSVFRPGVQIQRHWSNPTLMPSASHRVPSVLYKTPHRRYTLKNYVGSIRNTLAGGPWKTSSKLPLSAFTPELTVVDHMRAASSSPVMRTNGAIHMIPAPNLSLSEKPIVVVDASVNTNPKPSDTPKSTYEVTEKYPEPVTTKIEAPVGFTKPAVTAQADLENLFRNGAPSGLASEYGLPALALPQNAIIPHEFIAQRFNNSPNKLIGEENSQAGVKGIIIEPNILYQTDPIFFQRFQNQLLQRFPAIEFMPYTAAIPQQSMQLIKPQKSPSIEQVPSETQTFFQIQMPNIEEVQQKLETQDILLSLNNNLVTKQEPISLPFSNETNDILQRDAQESTLITNTSQEKSNYVQNELGITPVAPVKNGTIQTIENDSRSDTITEKNAAETSTKQTESLPVYFAKNAQDKENLIANVLYSANNDVKAKYAVVQGEKPEEKQNADSLVNDTNNTNLNSYFVQNGVVRNQTVTELRPLLGIPFSKTPETLKVAYTLLRNDDKNLKMDKDDVIYAGQIVQASISEDKDFNKKKAVLLQNRAPLRLFAAADIKPTSEKGGVQTSTVPSKVTIVKAKIPPESKLIFDDKTGEPVLRIYASYLDNQLQKEITTSKLTNLKYSKDQVMKKQDFGDPRRTATTRGSDKTHGYGTNHITFDLKLRDRSDKYWPLTED